MSSWPSAPPSRHGRAPESDRQCLYQAKRNSEETVTVELDLGPDGNKKSFLHDQRSKAGHQPITGIGDGAFTLRSPIGGIQLTFLKDDALVTLSLSSPKQANPQAAVTSLAKVAATKLTRPLPHVAVRPLFYIVEPDGHIIPVDR